nr:glycosyltransferase family 39 protein [Chloroflexota bacterium]
MPDPVWACGAALLLTVVTPGGLLAMLLVPMDDTDPVEWTVAALGLGVAVLVVNGLILSYLPLRLGATILLLWFDGLALALAALVWRIRPGWRIRRSIPDGTLFDLLVVLGLGAGLRLPELGYAEFQGDESRVVVAALAVLQDVPDALFYHGKGPAEVLVTALHYGLVGALSEASARLPFALANLAGLATVYLIARRLLGRPGALATALLLVFNGYLVVFGRFAQYQSLVFFLSALAVWSALRWSRGRLADHWPVLAGAFAGTGALAHYDAVFALPPIALLALGRHGLHGLLERRAALAWFAGGAVGLVLMLLFFGPYLLNPLYELAEDRFVRRGVGT